MSPYISTGAFCSRYLPEIVEQARTNGLFRLELSSDVAYAPDSIDVVRRCRNDFEFLLHNYFPAPADPFVLNLAAADPEMLARSRAHCRTALEVSAEVGAPVFAAHAGFAVQPKVSELGQRLSDSAAVPRPVAYAIFRDSVGDLIEHGRRLGVRFLVENNVVTTKNARDGTNPFLLLAEPAEIKRLASDIGDGFGMLMDVAHFKISARTLGFDPVAGLIDLTPLIAAYHLSDNDGLSDDNLPFDGGAWFLPYLDHGLPMTIEVYRVVKEQILSCITALKTGERKE